MAAAAEMPEGWGAWGLVALMIVVASWLLYRFAAPRGWREWSRAGLVQAFIIALYAEMYGFPLTLYVLTGFFGLDLPWLHVSGHLWATLLGYGEAGAVVEMMIGYTLVGLGIALLMTGWPEVYHARRRGELATGGVYTLVRHPQYLGILTALFGQILHWPTILTVALYPVIVWAYVRLARHEERALLARFGDAYRDYRRRVSMLVPRARDVRRLLEASPSPADR